MNKTEPAVIVKLPLSSAERALFEGRDMMCVPLSATEIADLKKAMTDKAMFIELMAQELSKARANMKNRSAQEKDEVAVLIECAERGRLAVEVARTLLGRAVFVGVDKEKLQ